MTATESISDWQDLGWQRLKQPVRVHGAKVEAAPIAICTREPLGALVQLASITLVLRDSSTLQLCITRGFVTHGGG